LLTEKKNFIIADYDRRADYKQVLVLQDINEDEALGHYRETMDKPIEDYTKKEEDNMVENINEELNEL